MILTMLSGRAYRLLSPSYCPTGFFPRTRTSFGKIEYLFTETWGRSGLFPPVCAYLCPTPVLTRLCSKSSAVRVTRYIFYRTCENEFTEERSDLGRAASTCSHHSEMLCVFAFPPYCLERAVPAHTRGCPLFLSLISFFSKKSSCFGLTLAKWCAIVIVHYQTATP